MKLRAGIWLVLVVVLGTIPAAAQGKGGPKRQAPLSRPLRNMPPMAPGRGLRVFPIRHLPHQRTLAEQAPGAIGDSAAQTQFGPLAPTLAGANLEGLGVGLAGFVMTGAPPDPVGAVGRTQYVQVVNTALAVFDKASNAVLAGPTDTSNLWSNLSGSNPCKTTNDGDAIVIYDRLADRWLITQFANASSGTGPFYQCVAISQTADATGQYFLYFFDFVNTNGTQRLFNDYPKVGVWPDAYYFSYNTFTAAGAGVGALLCAVDRTNMLDGVATLRGVAGPAGTASDSPPNTPAGQNQVCFNVTDVGLLPSDLDGTTQPPDGSPNFFLEWYDTTNLGLWKFHVDFGTLTNSTLNGVNWVGPAGPTASTILPQLIPVASFTPTCNIFVTGNPVCVPQCTAANCGASGTNQKLDSLSDRVMHRLAYRNFGSHESLVTNHSVATSGTSGSGIRWYEIQNPNGTPTVAQTGTWAPDANWRWMGSAAMDKFGNLAIGYSVSGTAMRPAIRYAARLATDTPGTLGNETSLIEGTGVQTGGLDRWGDYSALTLDPQDDCTFWYTNEYLATNGSFNWRTRIGSFKLAQCQTTPSNISVTPNTGSGSGGTFTYLYADTGGATAITTAQGMFNTSNSLTSACAFQYNRAANTLQIFQDGGTLNPTAKTVGVAGTLSNSQCTIDVGASSAGAAGNSQVVNLVVTFTLPGFAGTKNIYMNVTDSGGTTTGFQQMGTWTVQ